MSKMLFFGVIFAMALLGCTPGQPAVTPTQPEPTTPTATLPPQDAPILPPAAVHAAQEMLAAESGVPLEEITVRSISEMDWPDACLGLGTASEVCAAVITPGFAVTLVVEGETYEYRTNRDGSVIRRVEQMVEEGRIGEKSAALLAQVAGLKLEEIHFGGMESVDWPDSCLGAAEEGELCAQTITPGYQVMLEHSGMVYELHTNADASLGRLGGPPELLAAVRTRQVAAQELTTSLETVRLVSIEAVEWPNSCLGIEKEGSICLQVIVPGYRIVVESNGQQLEYHTNQDATAIKRGR